MARSHSRLRPFFFSHHGGYCCPWKPPKGSHIHWSLTTTLSNTCRNWQLEPSSSVTLQSLTRLCVGVLKLCFLRKTDRNKIWTKIVQFRFHLNSLEFARFVKVYGDWCPEKWQTIIICGCMPSKSPNSAANCICLSLFHIISMMKLNVSQRCCRLHRVRWSTWMNIITSVSSYLWDHVLCN